MALGPRRRRRMRNAHVAAATVRSNSSLVVVINAYSCSASAAIMRSFAAISLEPASSVANISRTSAAMLVSLTRYSAPMPALRTAVATRSRSPGERSAAAAAHASSRCSRGTTPSVASSYSQHRLCSGKCHRRPLGCLGEAHVRTLKVRAGGSRVVQNMIRDAPANNRGRDASRRHQEARTKPVSVSRRPSCSRVRARSTMISAARGHASASMNKSIAASGLASASIASAARLFARRAAPSRRHPRATRRKRS